ncbi:MAG: lysophospholipid acyltransferase family protein [Anaerolineae bacterium]
MTEKSSTTDKRPLQLTCDNSLRVRLGRRFMRMLGALLIWGSTVKATVSGLENIPRKGPAILLFNHLSQVDPPLVGGVFDFRDVTPIGKDELRTSLLTGWMVYLWQAITVKRGELDMVAMRRALYVLEHTNDLLLVAPEGHRNKTLSEPKEGFLLLAAKTGAVMVPAGISGTQHFKSNLRKLRRTPVTIHYGRPIRLKGKVSRKDYKAAADEVMYVLAQHIEDPSLRGAYADQSKATMNFIEFVD